MVDISETDWGKTTGSSYTSSPWAPLHQAARCTAGGHWRGDKGTPERGQHESRRASNTGASQCPSDTPADSAPPHTQGTDGEANGGEAAIAVQGPLILGSG